jgi:hypothetical protein
MAEIVLMRTPHGALIPADQQSMDAIAKLKAGVGIRASFKKENNLQFHRKLFALVNLGFDSWEPADVKYKGSKIEKNFDQFRDDITILAGFYTTSVRLNGDIKFTAKSWSFASMEQDHREELYSAVINVILSRILTKYTREDLDAVVDQVLRFA